MTVYLADKALQQDIEQLYYSAYKACLFATMQTEQLTSCCTEECFARQHM